MANQQSPATWLEEQFEFEYCHECGGDFEHHTVCNGPFGHYFARCDYPMGDNGSMHPTVAAYRAKRNTPYTDADIDIFVSERITINYVCRAIDPRDERERGFLTGRFTGDTDTWGKRTFVTDSGQVHYFFADELAEILVETERS
jgi:hypothetical protein